MLSTIQYKINLHRRPTSHTNPRRNLMLVETASKETGKCCYSDTSNSACTFKRSFELLMNWTPDWQLPLFNSLWLNAWASVIKLLSLADERWLRPRKLTPTHQISQETFPSAIFTKRFASSRDIHQPKLYGGHERAIRITFI